MDFFDPAFLDAASKLSVVAFFIAITVLWLRRIIITRAEKTDADAVSAIRLAEKDAEIAFLKGLVSALTRRLDRFQVVLERVTGVQVPRDPDAE